MKVKLVTKVEYTYKEFELSHKVVFINCEEIMESAVEASSFYTIGNKNVTFEEKSDHLDKYSRINVYTYINGEEVHRIVNYATKIYKDDSKVFLKEFGLRNEAREAVNEYALSHNE
jgi:hypothetical protein